MIDIIDFQEDLVVSDSYVPKAANILAVQIGSLEYEPDLGIDLEYFLNDDFEFEDESFKAYLVQRLAAYSIDVTSVTEQVQALYEKYTFAVSGNDNTQLIR